MIHVIEMLHRKAQNDDYYVGAINSVNFIKINKEAFLNHKDKLSDKCGIYILCNSTNSQIYIGETQDLYDRLATHIKKKDFWDYVIAFESASFTKTACTYIERNLIGKAREIGYDVQNVSSGFNQSIGFLEQAKCDEVILALCEVVNLLHKKEKEFSI